MVSHQYYLTTFHGTLVSDEAWEHIEPAAQRVLDRFKRIYSVSAPEAESESMAICEIAECLFRHEQIESGAGGPVQSTSIGSVSVSYGAVGGIDISRKGKSADLLSCARRHLEIYRGCSR